MFSRGQRFIIHSSNAKARQHPQMGDEGFLRNIFLFSDESNHTAFFAVVDAYFSKFRSDKVPNRSEHRRFIIDVSMSNELLSDFKKGLLIDRILPITTLISDDVVKMIDGKYTVSTAPYDDFGVLSQNRTYVKTNRPKLIKLPTCSIERTTPKTIHENEQERNAWIMSIRPTLYAINSMVRRNLKVPISIRAIIEEAMGILSIYLINIGKNKDRMVYEDPPIKIPGHSIVYDTARLIVLVHRLQNFIAALIKTQKCEPLPTLMELTRRHNDPIAALYRTYEAF